MAVFDSNHQRAAWLVAILGVVIIIALAPYASGLLGAPVLYIVFERVHQRLLKLVKNRSVASILVIIIALVGIVLPIAWMGTLLVGQAQGAAKAVVAWPGLQRLDALRIGSFEIGPQLREAGSNAVTFIGGSALSLLGSAAQIALNLMLTFFGLYYLLMDPGGAWNGVRPYIPFSDASVDILKARFAAVTKSTIIGSGVVALIQGALVALAFVLTGLGNPVFWGAVTVVFAILPVVGGGMVWIPAAIVLFVGGRTGAGVFMVLFCLFVVGTIDNFMRPYVSSRYAQIHPLITIVGAVAGVSYLGLMGLLIGPLALTYFFELLAMYRREYLRPIEVVSG